MKQATGDEESSEDGSSHTLQTASPSKGKQREIPPDSSKRNTVRCPTLQSANARLMPDTQTQIRKLFERPPLAIHAPRPIKSSHRPQDVGLHPTFGPRDPSSVSGSHNPPASNRPPSAPVPGAIPAPRPTDPPSSTFSFNLPGDQHRPSSTTEDVGLCAVTLFFMPLTSVLSGPGDEQHPTFAYWD